MRSLCPKISACDHYVTLSKKIHYIGRQVKKRDTLFLMAIILENGLTISFNLNFGIISFVTKSGYA